MNSGPIIYVASLAAAMLLFFAIIARLGGLWILDVRNGEVTVRRGKPPPRLLADFREILRSVPRATIKAHRVGARIELKFAGAIDDGTAQQLRNVLGVYQA